MRIELGASFFGSGGKRLGEVDGLVVNAGTKRATSVLVDAGLFDQRKHMVGVSALGRSDERGLHVAAEEARTDEGAPILASEEVDFPQRVEPPIEFIPAAGVGGPVVAEGPEVPGEYPDNSSFFDIAPLDPPPVEIESNLGENEVVLGKGSEVISSDDHKVGDVVAVELGDMGLVEQITVSEGFIFRERSNFSLAEIDELGTNTVHLRLTRDQAEAR